MLINTPALLAKGLLALFLFESGRVPGRSLLGRFATYVGSNARKEDYAWLTDEAVMKEYIAGMQNEFAPLRDLSYEITNKKFRALMRVLRDDVKDDQYGAIIGRMRRLAQTGQRHSNALIVASYLAGTVVNGLDGVPLYDNAHPDLGTEGVGVQDNLLAQTGTDATDYRADLALAIRRLLEMRSYNGEPYTEEIRKIGILCGPAARDPMKIALGATEIDATSNVSFDDVQIDLAVTPRISGAGFAVVNQDIDPTAVIFQDREALEFMMMEEGSSIAFTHEEYQAKVRARRNTGYGNFQTTVLVGALS